MFNTTSSDCFVPSAHTANDVDQDGGLIINIGSILGRVTFPFFGAMSALTPVRAFYDAVASGDISRILSILHPNLAWIAAEGFPYFSGASHHPQEVVEKLLIPLWTGLGGLRGNPTEGASRWRPCRRLRRLFWHGHACSVYAPLADS